MQKRDIYLLIPTFNEKQDKSLSSWLSSLPELSLLANIKTVLVPWKRHVTGSEQDWIDTVKQIQKAFPHAYGFVVWAPEQSLLQLSGTASLAFAQTNKPVILFAHTRPDVMKKKISFDGLGVKSKLINAVYAACSDIAEVAVLHEQTLVRPSSCQWSFSKPDDVFSSEAPLATIDFALNIHGPHRRREEVAPEKKNEAIKFSDGLRVISWLPGVESKTIEKGFEAAVVFADAPYWEHEGLQDLRKNLRALQMPSVFVSPTPWNHKTWLKNEVGVEHNQAWWPSLVSKFAFGVNKNPADALKKIGFIIGTNV